MSLSTVFKVAWLPVADRKVLFARSRGQELFYTIGGKPDPLENDHKALIREVREETSALLVPNTIRRAGTFVGPGHGNAQGKMTVLLVFSADYDGTLCASNEVEELAWFGIADRHRTTHLGREILGWLHAYGTIK